jgi:dCTP deaminase
MILSAQNIRKRKGLITPFYERTILHGFTFGLSPGGYDIRIDKGVYVEPGRYELASSIEYFNMSLDLQANVADKSTWARKGLCVQNTIIEPGWRGYLTLELTNHSKKTIDVPAGCPIAQIVFMLLDEPTEQPYEGKYQDQEAKPVSPILEDLGYNH